MTRIIITLLISILSFLLNAQESKTNRVTSEDGITIEVTIPNTSSNKGKVYFALYNSKDSFMQRIPFQKAEAELKDNKAEVLFTKIPKGEYAITCYHDANDNKKMDFDGIMPIEDYGSSNNPESFGPPQFDASKFEVVETNLTFEIKF